MYTWVPTHKAIAQKLLAYEHRQQEFDNYAEKSGWKKTWRNNNEIKDARLKDIYKRFTNLAVIKSLFDVNFRESVITKALVYGSFPAQKKLVEKYKALLRANGVAGE